MCKSCGCSPCKCGRKIVNKVCSGCGKKYNDCDCKEISGKEADTDQPNE